jgi:Domain of unknown function (DU1801)
MQSKATSVEQYLAELPEDRKTAIKAVRQVLLQNLDKDFEEGMQYGMIGYYVPHRIYPAGYHCDPRQPLPFACLASQKNYMSLYMMSIYGDPQQLKQFQDDWAKTGKKLDMGKSCIRFKRIEDFALDVVARAIKRVRLAEYVRQYEAILNRGATTKKAASKGTTGKSSAASKRPAKKKAQPAGNSAGKFGGKAPARKASAAKGKARKS